MVLAERWGLVRPRKVRRSTRVDVSKGVLCETKKNARLDAERFATKFKFRDWITVEQLSPRTEAAFPGQAASNELPRFDAW
jgi:hypothetical protein